MAFDINPRGLVSRQRPQVSMRDTTPSTPRWGRYREPYVISLIPNYHPFSDEGSYFVVTNKTPGVSVPYTVSGSVFSDTIAMITLYNTDVLGGKRIYPDYIRIIQSPTLPTSPSFVHVQAKLDVVQRATGGTPSVPVNVNEDSDATSIAQFLWTPIVSSPVLLTWIVGNMLVRMNGPVANDEWLFIFGPIDRPMGGLAMNTATATRNVQPFAPVAIDPGCTFLLHVIFADTGTPVGQYEYEMGWWER